MGLPCLWAPFTDTNSILGNGFVEEVNGFVEEVKSSKLVEKEENFQVGSTISSSSIQTSGMKFEEDDEELSSESSCSPKNEAAIMLQKAYKSFRTRRKLADCAVLIQNWRELVDFAKLEHSSVSFFEIDQQETAISRWSRAMTRAAKVGKGLSKNSKARKLALQHWLEAVDPRHRYGHNLHFYYIKWLQSCQSKEPFFYWLDIGEGKEINLEKCSRKKLQSQCIKYLGPMERLQYEVTIVNGRMYFKQSGEIVNTLGVAKWIFVLSASKVLYIGKKMKGSFQHSSFLAGGATSAAGRLVVDNGVLKAVWPHSGHYRPTPENFQEFISFLEENNVDISDVKMDPAEEDDEDDKLSSTTENQTTGHHSRSNSEEDLSRYIKDDDEDDQVNRIVEEKILSSPTAKKESITPVCRRICSRNLTRLEIPQIRDEEMMYSSKVQNEEEKTEAKSSCRWTTGAGPRISCVGDYPSKLHQVHALEQLSLSPRRNAATHLLKSESSPIRRERSSFKAITPDSKFLRGSSSVVSTASCRTDSSPLTDRTNVTMA